MDTSKEYYKNKQWLYEQYVVLEKSVKQLRRENGWGINTIKRWLKKTDIKIRQADNKIVCSQKAHKLYNHPKWKGKRVED